MNTLLLIVLIVSVWLAIHAMILRVAIRSSRPRQGGFVRIALLMAVWLLSSIGCWAVVAAFRDEVAGIWGLLLAGITANIVVIAPLLLLVLGGPFRDLRRIWVMQFVGGLMGGAVVFAVGHVCLGTAFIPNSSMSPNSRGYHVVETLPDGTHLVTAVNTPGDESGIVAGNPSGAIVAETYEYRETPRPARHTRRADMFLWNKTLAPQRWDAVVFSYFHLSEDRFVKRLVGMPGERIEIRDGMIWVNGQRLEPPARLGQIRYSSGLATDRNQWDLGPHECFLLGDHTDHCSDSRHFGPILSNRIHGVVTAIYWPPARWRANP